MKKIDLGQSLQIFANAGVILGIVFLVFELNQNQDIGRAQVRNEIARAEQELSMWDFDHAMDTIFRLQDGEITENDSRILAMR